MGLIHLSLRSQQAGDGANSQQQERNQDLRLEGCDLIPN
jgi:hypothetical protein